MPIYLGEMADVFVPGVKSRFDTDKMISGLMEIERVPRNRVEKEVESLKTQKENWQNLGRLISGMRESARFLFSYQNPFNDRAATSTDDAVLGAETTRDSFDQEHSFTVKQLAAADKFVSNPLSDTYTVPAGTYAFSTGKNEVSFKFGGGGIQEFTDTLNKRGEGKIAAQLIAVKPHTKSFIIESLDTGAETALTFAHDAEKFALNTGILSSQSAGPKLINIPAAAEGASAGSANLAVRQTASGDGLAVSAMSQTRIPLNDGIVPTDTMIFRFETSVSGNEAAEAADRAYERQLAQWQAAQVAAADTTPAEEAVDAADTVPAEEATDTATADTTPAEETAAAEAESAAAPPPSPPPRVDNLNVLTLYFNDGTSAELNPVKDAKGWNMQSYQLAQISKGADGAARTAMALGLNNGNTHRDISIKDIQIFDPVGEVKTEPRAPVSRAQNAIIVMDGIEIERPTNKIDDLVPGMTLNPRSVSDTPITLGVKTDTSSVKDSVISLVGNYNKLMAELNVLTRNDETLIRELNYLTPAEQDELRKRLGAFSGDSSLLRFKSSLQEIVGGAYYTATGERILLQDFGITTDARRGGGYDPTKMRGYLEINETTLDESLKSPSKLNAMRQIFGLDTDNDKIVDSGIAFRLDTLARPYVELGGIIAMRSSGIDTKIAANERRIETLDRQLEQKEAALRSQYGQMEGAYTRMERLSNSLDQFSRQNSGNR
jgi:flagellar hook-associated protein 2